MHYFNKLNGFGLTYGSSLDENVSSFSPWFDDYETYVNTMVDAPAVLLSGEPGAGKSHIAEDVVQASRMVGKECLQIWCHINGSSIKGRSKTEELLARLIQARSEGVLVLDNLDYAVYTGGNRKNKRSISKALAYKDFLKNVVGQAVESDVNVLATGHTPQWRAYHSRIPQAEDEFNSILPAATHHITFTGVMTEENVRRILVQRNILPADAATIAQRMHALGRLTFRNAYHIDPQDTTPAAIDTALQTVEEIKNQKLHGGR
jgi:hypothetical protein